MSQQSRRRRTNASTTVFRTAAEWDREAAAESAVLRPCARCGSDLARWYHAMVLDPTLPAVVQFCLCDGCAPDALMPTVREYVAETEERVSAQRGRRFAFAPRAQVAVCIGPYAPGVPQ